MLETTYGISPVVELNAGAGNDIWEDSIIRGNSGRLSGVCGHCCVWGRSWFGRSCHRLSWFGRSCHRLSWFSNSCHRLSWYRFDQRLSWFNRICYYRINWYCWGKGWRRYNTRIITRICRAISLRRFITVGGENGVWGWCGITYLISTPSRLHIARDTCWMDDCRFPWRNEKVLKDKRKEENKTSHIDLR